MTLNLTYEGRDDMANLKPGDTAPAFEAYDQNNTIVRSKDFSGQRLFLFFYPKANTSG